jgi:excisionase family DNA binding protein
MTGRELIVYILQNNLEDEELFKDGKLLGYMTVSEAAATLKVGEATVRALIDLGAVSYVKINDLTYVSAVDISEHKAIDPGKVSLLYNYCQMISAVANGGKSK